MSDNAVNSDTDRVVVMLFFIFGAETLTYIVKK